MRRKPFRHLAVALGLAAWSGLGSAQAQSQLELGYYVIEGVSCAAASNVDVSLVHWSGINAARMVCDFTAVTPAGPNRYNFVQSCLEIGTESQVDVAGRIIVHGKQSFELQVASGNLRYRFCPQDSLPEPWRSNDLTDYHR